MNVIQLMRDIVITKEFDVIVVGSGPAGLAAAVSAARKGVKTALLERYGVLGGNLTLGHVGPLMGKVSSGTMVEEIHKALGTWFEGPHHDIEKSKIFFINWVRDAGVDVYLQTPVVDTVVRDHSIEGIVIAGKNGLEVLKAKVVIDTTGDGTVACLAGAEVMMGREGDNLLQPVTQMFTVTGVDYESALFCGGERCEIELNGERYVDFCKRINKAGQLPESVSIVRLYRSVNKGEVMVNATQENYINGLEASDIAKAEMSLRNQAEIVTDFLRKYVPGYDNCYIKDSADTLGIRETRRIKGEYVLEDDDLIFGRKFCDVMVHNAEFVIDIHNPKGGGQAEGVAARIQPYDIPYRCFIPLKVDNLMTAGRCISGTHRAHASYRVMNICIAMGQAVGIAAALSAENGVIPRELDYRRVQNELMFSGINLFD